jgi:hypothetical protein
MSNKTAIPWVPPPDPDKHDKGCPPPGDDVTPGGGIKVKLKVEAFEPCPIHAPAQCDCPKVLVSSYQNDADLTTAQFAQFVMCNILASAQTIKAEDATTASYGGATPATITAPTIEAGTSGTAAATADYVLGTATGETVAATVNAYSAGSFTLTGTITATANRAYQEVGLRITTGGKNFLICHDTFTTQNVSNTGTLAVTYTMTFT